MTVAAQEDEVEASRVTAAAQTEGSDASAVMGAALVKESADFSSGEDEAKEEIGEHEEGTKKPTEPANAKRIGTAGFTSRA